MRLTQLIPGASILLTLNLLSGSPVFAQAPTCQLAVTVINKNGDLVEGARVLLRPPSKTGVISAAQVTDAGEVIFDNLKTGFYTLIVTKARYKRVLQTESLICVEQEETMPTEVVLERGNPRQTVTTTILRTVQTAMEVPGPDSSSSSSPERVNVSLPQEDYGVDIAAVAVASHFLVDEPDSSTIVLKMAGGDLLTLVERTPIARVPKEEWYQVIHLASGLVGWARGDAIKIKYSERKKSTPLFREEKTRANMNPSVEIHNDSDVELTFRIRGKIYVAAAQSKRLINLPPGTYKYYGFAPGVIPSFGEQRFSAGHKYTWQFSGGVKVG